MRRLNENGALDMIVVVIVVVVVAAGGFAYWRITSSNDDLASVENVDEISQLESLPDDLEGIKTIEEIEVIAGVTDTVGVVGFVLEAKDDHHVYIVTLSNGKKLTIHATTGEVLNEEDGEVLVGAKLATAEAITVSASEAYSIASSMSSSGVVQIELEIEDDKATYKVEFEDGSKVEISAITGSVVKSEIKDESYESEDSEDEYEEPEAEEQEQEEEHEEDSEDAS